MRRTDFTSSLAIYASFFSASCYSDVYRSYKTHILNFKLYCTTIYIYGKESKLADHADFALGPEIYTI